jgi:hypothetical protein
LVQEIQLDENDLDWMAEGDEIYDLYLDEGEVVYSDTIKKDSVIVKPVPPRPKGRNVSESHAPEPRTNKLNPPIPSAINWDDLETEDILYYLIEEKGEDDDL